MSIFSLSALGHIAALALIFLLAQQPREPSKPQQYVMVKVTSRSAPLAFAPARTQAAPKRAKLRLPGKLRVELPSPTADAGESEGLKALRGRAQKFTKGLVADFRFRGDYGFSIGDYQLAVQTSGALPTIPATDLPPRFEQYLTIEVTIDEGGHVADARLVNGEVTPKIEQTLIAAIRDFKYVPAKRNGTPIPSQLDIVIHIPS